jgi:hypothetical protein
VVGSRTFASDALNRLTSASGSFGPNQTQTTETYRYDATGNILEKAGILYAYSDPLHPSAVISLSDGKTYTYDLNGNMLTGAGRATSWDADNRLAAVTLRGQRPFPQPVQAHGPGFGSPARGHR